MLFQAAPLSSASAGRRAPVVTALGALRRHALRPLLILATALLGARATMIGFGPHPYQPPQHQQSVRYSVGANGIVWNCTEVEREQFVASWTMTRAGIPYLTIAACSPA